MDWFAQQYNRLPGSRTIANTNARLGANIASAVGATGTADNLRGFADNVVDGSVNWRGAANPTPSRSSTTTNSTTAENPSGNQTNQNPAYYGNGPAQPAYDQAAITGLESQIGRTQSQIKQLTPAQKTAFANLVAQRDNQTARLQKQFDRTQADHNQSVGSTQAGFSRAKERIGENVRQNTTSLQRLMGARGAGSSSASQILAPWAAARAGTSEREEEGRTFSENMEGLNRNWGRFEEDWKQNREDLLTDYKNQRSQTRSGFAEREVQLQNALGELQTRLAQARGGGNVNLDAVNQRIDSLLRDITKYSRQAQSRVLNAKEAGYVAPELSGYDQEMRGIDSQDDPTYDETQYYYPVRQQEEEDQFLQQLYQ